MTFVEIWEKFSVRSESVLCPVFMPDFTFLKTESEASEVVVVKKGHQKKQQKRSSQKVESEDEEVSDEEVVQVSVNVLGFKSRQYKERNFCCGFYSQQDTKRCDCATYCRLCLD